MNKYPNPFIRSAPFGGSLHFMFLVLHVLFDGLVGKVTLKGQFRGVYLQVLLKL